MIDLLKKLLCIKSISPFDMGCQSIIIKELKKIGFLCYKLNKKNTNNVWAVYGKIKPIICFAGHTDVVNYGNITAWKYKPFTPIIKNNYVYGRGSSDMKGALISQVFAVKSFIQKYKKINGTISFLITSDEEGNGYNGTHIAIKLLRRKKITIDNLIIGEPTSNNMIGDNIKIGRRGSLNIKIIFYGSQGHVAYPHQSLNSINFAIPIVNKINNIIWHKINREFPVTNLQFTSFTTDNKANNIIPDKLEVVFNLRFSPFYSASDIKNKVINYLKFYPFKFVIKFQLSAKPFISNINSNFIKILNKSIYNFKNIMPNFTTDGGVSDSRFLIKNVKNIVECGLLNNNIHKDNEHLILKNIYDLHNIYYYMLIDLFKK